MSSQTFILPFPPSVNRMWRSVNGRAILSKEGREYRASVLSHLWGVEFDTWICPVRVSITAIRPDARRRDLDNLLKGILDAMKYARVFEDDSQVHDLRIQWAGPDILKGGKVVVVVEGMQA